MFLFAVVVDVVIECVRSVFSELQYADGLFFLFETTNGLQNESID